jgi:hypothetical protein
MLRFGFRLRCVVDKHVNKHSLITAQDDISDRYASICIIRDTFAKNLSIHDLLGHVVTL